MRAGEAFCGLILATVKQRSTYGSPSSPEDRRLKSCPANAARRIVNAKLDPTFLMADAEIVATYELYNINHTKLENLIHRIFDSALLNIEIKDRFGQPAIPREWFLAPPFVINEAVDRSPARMRARSQIGDDNPLPTGRVDSLEERIVW
jgi:hypothetical protein